MKFLPMFIVLSAFSACGLEEDGAQHKFAIRKKVKKIVYHYAKYRFAHDDYEDVDVAVKVAVQSGQAQTLWVRDLTVVANPLEEATLTTSSTDNTSFSGTSASDVGGTYTGVLETNKQGEIIGCCGEMTFVPTATCGEIVPLEEDSGDEGDSGAGCDNTTIEPTLKFVGIKLEDLTAAQWEQLNESPITPTVPTLMVAELGSQKVGVLFSITGADSVQRLEAHNAAGKVENALGRWQTEAGDDIFAVADTDKLFLTDTAMTAGVTELIGFDADNNKVLKANLTVEARSDTITLTASRFALAGYTWIAFSANPNPDPNDSKSIQDVEQNTYLSLNADQEVHAQHTGAINYSGYDGRGFWVGIYIFECLVGNQVLAKVVNTVYMGNCVAEGS